MAVESNSVKCGPTHAAGQPNETSPTVRESELVQPGTTWSEFIAKVSNLKMPGEGFADDLEAIQASQGPAEMPEWPD